MRRKQDTVVSRPDLLPAVMEYNDKAGELGFIGQQVMPEKEVALQSSTYPVIPKEALLSMPETARAARGTYNRDDWDFENGFFACREYGFEAPVDDTERKLYQDQIDGDEMGTLRATRIVKMQQEYRVASRVFNASIFTPHALTNEWDDAANATPIDDIKTGGVAIYGTSGYQRKMLSLICAYSVFENIKNTAQIVERLKYTYPMKDFEQIGAKELAHILGIKEVLVGGAIYNTAKKGQDAVIGNLWSGEYAMLTKISDGPDISEPGLGRTFRWTEDSPQNIVVEQYREEERRSDIFRVRQYVDERLIQSYAADGTTVLSNIADSVSYLFSNVTT